MPSTSNKLLNFMRYLALSLVTAIAVTAFAGPLRAQQMTPAEINQRVDQLPAKLTLQQKIQLIGGVDSMFTYAMPQIGLPRLKMSDASMGVRVLGPSIDYAAGIGLASSWDPELAYQVGKAIGQDARARGVNFVLGPGVNIYRLPVNGRNFEFLGEDPYLGSRIAVPYIEGMESEHVAATIKHYVANNSEYNRMHENAFISQRTLREIYLPIFDVKNTGSRSGCTVGEVYVSDPSAKVPRPEIELKGFERVTLEPGATRHVSVKLDKRSLAYWDESEHGWKVDPGTFEISVGSSSENLPLKEKFTVR